MNPRRSQEDSEASLALLCDLSRAGAKVIVCADGVHVKARGRLEPQLKGRLARHLPAIAFLGEAIRTSGHALAGQVLLAGMRALGYEAEAVGHEVRWWPHEPANEAVRDMLRRWQPELLLLLHTAVPLSTVAPAELPLPLHGGQVAVLTSLLGHCQRQIAAHRRSVAYLSRPVCPVHVLPYWRKRASAQAILGQRWQTWAQALERLTGGGPNVPREALSGLLDHVRRQARRSRTLARRRRYAGPTARGDDPKWAEWELALEAALRRHPSQA
jgi:hypothetical protein